jgi:outer membrane lipoprotein-sorting protein
MNTAPVSLALVSLFLLSPYVAAAQTADEVIEKSLTALGGRAALAKLKSRSTAGTITLSTPAGEVAGSVEIWNALPNKTRTLIKVDLSSLGAGPLVLDQRFNGKSGYVLDSLQGNREMTEKQVDSLKNGAFPTPFLNYKDMGTSVRLSGKEKVGDRDAYALIFEPVSGSAVRQYIDAETYLPIKAVAKIDVPQLGQEVEQTTEFADYKDVDGIKLPFRINGTSAVQSYSINISKVEHNVDIDDALFSKPAVP